MTLYFFKAFAHQRQLLALQISWQILLRRAKVGWIKGVLNYLQVVVIHVGKFLDEVAAHVFLYLEDSIELLCVLVDDFINRLNFELVERRADIEWTFVYFFVVELEASKLLKQRNSFISCRLNGFVSALQVLVGIPLVSQSVQSDIE
jgi:hypothetical protein